MSHHPLIYVAVVHGTWLRGECGSAGLIVALEVFSSLNESTTLILSGFQKCNLQHPSPNMQKSIHGFDKATLLLAGNSFRLTVWEQNMEFLKYIVLL